MADSVTALLSVSGQQQRKTSHSVKRHPRTVTQAAGAPAPCHPWQASTDDTGTYVLGLAHVLNQACTRHSSRAESWSTPLAMIDKHPCCRLVDRSSMVTESILQHNNHKPAGTAAIARHLPTIIAFVYGEWQASHKAMPDPSPHTRVMIVIDPSLLLQAPMHLCQQRPFTCMTPACMV
jgi:hypothetical protein